MALVVMSIHYNRAKFNKALTSMEYTRKLKSDNLYCYICVRRAGSYTASCHPSTGNEGWIRRMKRTWKRKRKTQWKN
jgi:hypothetical protein